MRGFSVAVVSLVAWGRVDYEADVTYALPDGYKNAYKNFTGMSQTIMFGDLAGSSLRTTFEWDADIALRDGFKGAKVGGFYVEISDGKVVAGNMGEVRVLSIDNCKGGSDAGSNWWTRTHVCTRKFEHDANDTITLRGYHDYGRIGLNIAYTDNYKFTIATKKLGEQTIYHAALDGYHYYPFNAWFPNANRMTATYTKEGCFESPHVVVYDITSPSLVGKAGSKYEVPLTYELTMAARKLKKFAVGCVNGLGRQRWDKNGAKMTIEKRA